MIPAQNIGLRFAILLGKVFTDARDWGNPETKESLVRFLLTLNKGMEMAASKIPQDVRVANRNLSKALDCYSSIDRWDLPNRFRVQDIDPVLFDHQIIDIKRYNAWEDQHLTPQQKNDIAKLIYERFKDDTDIATQNYFFVVERTSEGVDALAGAIGARAARSRNPQPPIKPQGISKGSNIKGIKVNWGQATTFINERFEALQRSVGQLPKNKLAYDGPNVNYKSSTQKPLEPTKNQIEVRKYYPGSKPENSESGSTSGNNKNSSGEGTGQGLKVPQGLTQAQFDKVSSMIREKVGHISDDIVVQGSRAKGTAKPTSDIDIAIRVPAEKFDELIQSSFSKVKPPNPGSAKEKTMLHAIETGKIQSGEAKLSKFREQLQQELGMDVDISIIKIGGPFDNPPFTPLK